MMTAIYALRVAVLGALLIWTGYSFGEPTHKASGGGVEVVVYSEACALKEVTNLPKRATWTENGKVVEGCAGVVASLAVFYWSDRTVTVAPSNVFVRVIGA